MQSNETSKKKLRLQISDATRRFLENRKQANATGGHAGWYTEPRPGHAGWYTEPPK